MPSGTSWKLATSTSPWSVILSSGMTDSARKLRVMKGAVIDTPMPASRRSIELRRWCTTASGHVGVVDAEDHDVVRVMRDRRRERSTLEPDVGGKAQADAPSGMMAFEDRDLDQVSRWVGDDAPIADGGLRYLNSRQELARYDPHDPDLPRSTWNAKRIRCHRGEMDGLPHPFRHGELGEMRRSAALENLAWREGREVVEHQDVRLVAGSDGSEVPEPVIGGGIDGRHHDRILGTDAVRHCHTHHLVDVALLDDEAGLAVVGAEHAPVGAEFFHERQEIPQVAGDRGLAEHDPHPQAPLFERLLVSGRLVIRPDARGDVRIEGRASDPGSVAIHMVCQPGRELRNLRLVAGDDSREVHHLGHPDRAMAAKKALDVAGREWPPR